MPDISDQISALLREVKQTKPARGKKAGKPTSEAEPKQPKVINPWVDEALVLIATTTTCKYCGNEVTAWSPHIYIERSRLVHKRVTKMIERLPQCDPDNAYTYLPRRVEHRHHTTCHCHICFGNLPNGFPHGQVQLQFPFEETIPQRQEENDNG